MKNILLLVHHNRGREARLQTPLAEQGAALRADYVGMAAYGRGWLRETFGGVTRHMLAENPCPLLCH